MSDVWQAIDLLLENGWPGEFGDASRAAYRTLLADYEPSQVVEAIKVCARRGATFRPSASEITAALEADPGKPTWSELYSTIVRVVPVRPDAAALDRANAVHPRIGAFIEAVGLDRLRQWPVNDPEYGALERERLRNEWERFDERADEREAHGLPLTAGPRRRQLGPRPISAALPAATGEAA